MTDTNEQPLSFLLPTIPANLKSAILSLGFIFHFLPYTELLSPLLPALLYIIFLISCTTFLYYPGSAAAELQTSLLNLVCRWPMKQPRFRVTQEEHQTLLRKTWINCRLRFKEALLN